VTDFASRQLGRRELFCKTTTVVIN